MPVESVGRSSDPFDTPAPIRYKVAPGKTGVSKDAVVRLLVEDYGVEPEKAVALAPRLIGQNDPLVEQAIGKVADRETARLQAMTRYMELKRKLEKGEQLDEPNNQWLNAVDARHREIVKQQADSAYQTQQGELANPRPPAPAAPNPDDQPVDPRIATMSAFRPGMEILPGQKGLRIPIKQPQPPEHPVVKTAKALMSQFGADPASAAAFAQQLHGVTVAKGQ